MAWTTMAAIYFITWWVVLFAVLPFGIRSQHEDGTFAPGTDPGAPVATGFGKKLVWTTIVTTMLFAAFYVVYESKTVTLDDLATLWGVLR